MVILMYMYTYVHVYLRTCILVHGEVSFTKLYMTNAGIMTRGIRSTYGVI